MWTALLRLPHRRPVAVVLPRPAAVREPEQPEPNEDDLRPGCGWFDSSHDLHHGLCVRELAEPASLARELPLPAWIDWQLAACSATHSAARP